MRSFITQFLLGSAGEDYDYTRVQTCTNPRISNIRILIMTKYSFRSTSTTHVNVEHSRIYKIQLEVVNQIYCILFLRSLNRTIDYSQGAMESIRTKIVVNLTISEDQETSVNADSTCVLFYQTIETIQKIWMIWIRIRIKKYQTKNKLATKI